MQWCSDWSMVQSKLTIIQWKIQNEFIHVILGFSLTAIEGIPPVVTSLSLAIQKLGGLPSIAVRWMGRCEIRRELAAVNIPWILAWKTIPLNWCRIWPIHSTWLAKCQSYWCQIRGSNQFDLWLGRTMEQCHPPTISQPNNSDNDHNGSLTLK